MDEFYRIKRLPPYVFAIVNDLKTKARARGEDIIDLGMGNPDMPTPKHIVAKLVEAAQNPKNHRYSASKGITRLRRAMAKWYRDRYQVDLDHDAEVIATIGAKEGMAHLALAVLQPGDGVLVPNPTYPIHAYSVVIADGDLRSVPLTPDGDFFERLFAEARWTALFWVVTAVALLAGERLHRRTEPRALTVWGALLIGAAQALALAPGISRSGATIVAGLGLGLSRPEAARFAFLLAIPAIAGGGLTLVPDIVDGTFVVNGSMMVGFVVAAVSGYAAVATLLRYVRAHSLAPFSVYLFAVAPATLIALTLT